jgi:hypothetical protein
MMWEKVFDLLLSRWDFVSANPAAFSAVLLIGAASGYFVARWHYEGVRKQIDFLKDKVSHLEKHADANGVPVPPVKAESVVPLAIPLVEAARKAFDATRDTAVAEIALNKDGGSTASVLHWYSTALAQRLTVYGTWAYASEPCEIELKPGSGNFMVIVDNDIAVYNRANTFASKVHVLAAELPAAIKDLKKLGKKVA